MVGERADRRHHPRGTGAADRRPQDPRDVVKPSAAAPATCCSTMTGRRVRPLSVRSALELQRRRDPRACRPARRRPGGSVGARCSGYSPHTGAIRLAAGDARSLQSPQRRYALGHRPGGARPRRRNRSRTVLTIRENIFLNPGALGRSCSPSCRRGAENAAGRRARRARSDCARTTRRWRSRRCRAATSRRSWSGAGWQPTRKLLICRGSDRRRRRRRQGRDLRAAQRGARARASASSSSRPISRRWPRSATAPWSSARARSSASSPGVALTTDTLIQAASAGKYTAAEDAAMQSLESNAAGTDQGRTGRAHRRRSGSCGCCRSTAW